MALFAESAARIGVEYERARSQAALRESESRLHHLLRGIAKASWETDAGGKGSEGWLEAIHPDDRARAGGMWRDAVRNAAGRAIPVRYQDPEGEWLRASVVATPLLDEQGGVRAWSGCIIGVDERIAAPSGSI